jgi:hypothetical protein
MAGYMGLKASMKSVATRFAQASGVAARLDAHATKLNALSSSLTLVEDHVLHVDRGTQILLALKYRDLAAQGVRCAFDDVEFRNYSQNGEDGILWYIFSVIGTTNKKCVEICAGSGRQCNTSNLIINHGWTGVLFDGDEGNVARGRKLFASHPDTFTYPPRFVHAWITAENVDSLIRDNGSEGEIDLFSLDIDGVDYWIWNAVSAVSPRVVIAEVQAIWGSERSVSVPYAPDFKAGFFQGFGIYSGASLPAFVKLGKKKGYRLVGCQRYGFNAIFLRHDVGRHEFPEISAGQCFNHPFAKWAYDELRPKVVDKQWVEV